MFRIGSDNAIAKRFEASGRTRIPGFVGIVVAIDSKKQTVDLWVQGTGYVMRGVRYGATLRNPPEWIRVRSSVYVRYPNGNRSNPEVEGPAGSIPTTKAGSTTLPPIGAALDAVLTGCRVVQSAIPGRRVVVETGTIRFGGSTATLAPAAIGQDLATRSPAVSGVPKISWMARVGTSYSYVPVGAAPASSGAPYRYDNIEIDTSLRLYCIQGVDAVIPVPLDVTPGRMILGYVLRRYGQDAVVDSDIQTTIQNTAGILLLSARAARDTIVWGDTNPIAITVTVQEYNGSPVNGHPVIGELISGTGQMTPYDGITNSSGIVTFSYTRSNLATDVSPVLNFRSTTDPTLTEQLTIVLLDSVGLVM